MSDTSKSEQKKVLCNANGVLLLVVWAPVDRPTMEELLVSCQAAIDEAGVIHRLELPPNTKVEELASVLPQKLRARLLAMDHDPIGYDTDPSRRGYIRSRCRLSNQEVSQAAYSLKAVRGCKFCEAHVSNAPARKLKARTAAAAGWESHRGSGTRRAHDKITDEIVRFVRKNSSVTETELSEEVERCFGVRISPSGLGYARSGKTHSHLNDKYPPIRKTASNYDQDHPAVKLAIELRDQGLSLNRIASRLFEEHHSTLKGTKFAAAQIKNFLRFAGPVQRNYSDHESRTLRNGDLSMG